MATPTSLRQPLLELQQVSAGYGRPAGLFSRGNYRRVIDQLNLQISRGESVGLVGDSGCGKSTLGRLLLKLLPLESGRILYHPAPGDERLSCAGPPLELASLNERRFRPLRSRVQIIFQDPWSSLNSRLTVAEILAEPLTVHRPELSAGEREELSCEALAQVGLQSDHLRRYPHQFSGGQRQRIGIARAIILRPELLICDEAVSALDLSVQAQILNLLLDLQQQLGLSYLFISHNRDVVRHIAERTLRMEAGRLVL